LIHRRREITDGTVVLVGGKGARDMNPVEQPPAGCDPGEHGGRRMSIRVDPEGGPVVHEEMIEHERLQDRDATAPLHVKQRDAAVERRQQHFVRSQIGLISEGSIAVSAPRRLVHR